MTDERAYARAAVIWAVTTVLVLLFVESRWGSTTADLVAWIPFAMCLRCTWKWWQSRRR